MARKFLYFVAFCIVLVIAGRIVYELFQEELAEIALVPSAEFSPVKPLEANAYEDSKLWYSRPGIGVKDPARWQPPLTEGAPAATPDATKAPRFAVFFVHPTSYLNRASWNAPLENGGDPEAERIARIYLRGMPAEGGRHGKPDPFGKLLEILARFGVPARPPDDRDGARRVSDQIEHRLHCIGTSCLRRAGDEGPGLDCGRDVFYQHILG